MADPVIGIDLGTTFTVVAHVDNAGRPWTVANAEGDLATPSVVYFDKTGAIVGKEAVKASVFEPGCVAQFVKRNMGDPAYERAIDGHQLPPEVIQALILRKVKQDAELRLGPIRRAAITVPAYFNEPRRKATQDAGRLAGLDVVDIINEPTAAAVAFGVQQGFLTSQGASPRKETVLVYDLGGGTFDVTLMEIEGQDFKAVATAGDIHLGGVDWDLRIADFVAQRCREQLGSDLREDEQARQTLLLEAADAKHSLSVRTEVLLQMAHAGHRVRVPLDRVHFELLTGDLLDRTLLTVRKVLREAKREWTGVTRLLLVGGSTRMPMVQRALENESGFRVDRSLAPDEAVAHGAAIYASLLAAGASGPKRGMSLTNVNSHDLGVLGIEPDTGMRRKKVLIPRNTPLPAAGHATFATRKVSQSNVRVSVIEGGDAAGDHATHIGKCVVAGLPPGLPAKTPVEVSVRYTTDGRLTVAATLPETGRHAQVTIHRSAGLAEERLAEWRKRIETGDLLSDAPTDEELEPDDTSDLDEFLLPSSAIRSTESAESSTPKTAGQASPAAPTEAVDKELRDFFRQLGRRVAHITTPTATREEERTED